MQAKIHKVKYIKPSSQGCGNLPIGTEGFVLIYIDNPITPKILSEFQAYGKYILPLSSVKQL